MNPEGGGASGIIGSRGLAAIPEGQTALGEQQVLQMFMVAFTIAAGLLLGNTIVRPKGVCQIPGIGPRDLDQAHHLRNPK